MFSDKLISILFRYDFRWISNRSSPLMAILVGRYYFIGSSWLCVTPYEWGHTINVNAVRMERLNLERILVYRRLSPEHSVSRLCFFFCFRPWFFPVYFAFFSLRSFDRILSGKRVACIVKTNHYKKSSSRVILWQEQSFLSQRISVELEIFELFTGCLLISDVALTIFFLLTWMLWGIQFSL